LARVLVVDDDGAVAALMQRILEREGHTVHTAEDGQAALRHLDGASADLMVTDILMPNMEGLALIQRCQSLYPSMKIIALSGLREHMPVDYLAMAQNFGAHRVLEKPVNVSVLRAAVLEALSSPKPAA
jgi:DNA-binding NtrC family response regulator